MSKRQVERRGILLTNEMMEKLNMKNACDLHTHSTFSDGTYTPTELIRAASSLGLGAIALTDHNTVAGLPEFMAAAETAGITAVPGVEFSTDFEGLDVHILGLFIRPEHYRAVSDFVAEGCRQKEQSNIELIRALRADGFDVNYAEIKARCAGGHFHRGQVAAVLTEKGYTSSIKEAFRTLLSEEQGYYHPPKRPGSFDVIRFIKSLGAAAVLAHPLLTMEEPTLRRFLVPAVESGLDAMETVYSTYDDETAALAERIAAEFGLLRSGGSDFHGSIKPDTSLGTGRGQLLVPLEFSERLKSKITLSD